MKSPTNFVARQFFLLSALIIFSWTSLNHVSHLPVGYDSSWFVSNAQALLRGEVLYRDVARKPADWPVEIAWISKPPVIFALNAGAMMMGGEKIESIRFMEHLFAVMGCVLVYCILLKMLKSIGLAIAGAYIYAATMFDPRILEGGNLTEEYGVVFMLGGILCAIGGDPKVSKLRIGLSGCLFSLAVLTKEPFIFSTMIWLICLVSIKGFSKTALWFALGFLAPIIMFAAYLLSNDAAVAWFESTTLCGFKYMMSHQSAVPWRSVLYEFGLRVLNQDWMIAALFFAGVASCLSKKFVRNNGGWPVWVLAAFAIDFIGTSTSGRALGHYYMQVAPSFSMLAAFGLKWICFAEGEKK